MGEQLAALVALAHIAAVDQEITLLLQHRSQCSKVVGLACEGVAADAFAANQKPAHVAMGIQVQS